MHSGLMSDLLHDHLTFGFRRGCKACAQTQEDLARSGMDRGRLTYV